MFQLSHEYLAILVFVVDLQDLEEVLEDAELVRALHFLVDLAKAVKVDELGALGGRAPELLDHF